MQKYGGVIHMLKGTALFDTVEISDTATEYVREWRFGRRARAGCPRTVCGSMRRLWFPRLHRTAAWFAWQMGSSLSGAARSRTPRR